MLNRNGQKIRILHVVNTMNRGGVEIWLWNLLGGIDRNQYQFEFLLHTEDSTDLDSELEALGIQIHRVKQPKNPVSYCWRLWKFLREQGPYDVVHTHLGFFSGLVAFVSQLAGIPVRISHSHADRLRVATPWRHPVRRLYEVIMSWLIRHFASSRLAVSEGSAEALYGSRWRDDPRVHVLPLGINLGPFFSPVDGMSLRDELGIPRNARVVGHVGRFDPQKNHHFLVEVAESALGIDDDYHFLLIGDGPLRSAVESEVARLGISDRFTFAGVRRDVPALMMGVMDAFLFPSLWEGRPVALLEAQAAGLPCIVSNAISQEVDVVPTLIERVEIDASAPVWAQAMNSYVKRCEGCDRQAAVTQLADSDANIERAALPLLELYRASLRTNTLSNDGKGR